MKRRDEAGSALFVFTRLSIILIDSLLCVV